jgi:membrane protein YdbS with pleckstrin-like domain
MKYLAARERLVTTVRLHWAILLPSIGQTLGVVVLALAIDIIAGPSLVSTVLWWAVLAMVVRMLWKLYDWNVERLMITDKRILKISGIVTRKVATMPLVKVTDLIYKRDPMGRLLGYGEFIVESAGQDQALAQIEYLPRPDRLYLTLCDMMFGGAPSPAGARDDD